MRTVFKVGVVICGTISNMQMMRVLILIGIVHNVNNHMIGIVHNVNNHKSEASNVNSILVVLSDVQQPVSPTLFSRLTGLVG